MALRIAISRTGLETLEVVGQLWPWDPSVLGVLLDEGLDLGLLLFCDLRFGPYYGPASGA